jgi:triosephosphate isomerase
MMAKQFMIAGNWKMFKTVAESREFVTNLAKEFNATPGLTVAVFPPFIALDAMRGMDPKIHIGAQNMFYEEKGAFTGEVSPLMLQGLAEFILVGHSERREIFHESDEEVNKKLLSALKFKLNPVLCVGETLPEREAGETLSKIKNQLDKCLQGVAGGEWEKITLAYEPIWAIGTGRNATPEQAQDVHRFIRRALEEKFPGNRIPILYGGSVKPENSLELLSQEDISGVLVGGASLKVEQFSAIIRNGLKLLKS